MTAAATGVLVVFVAACGASSKKPEANIGQPSATAGVPTGTPASPVTHTYVFPVKGKNGYSRGHHDYPATDIISPCGTDVVAVTDGVVLETSLVDTWDPKVNSGDSRGGLSISILGDDGVRYYGSHLGKIESTVNPGARVRAGQKIGEIGQSGDARVSVCHLHFGISPLCGGVADWWTRRGTVWPWSYLDAWKAGTPKSPVAEVKKWQDDHGCPPSPDHTGGPG
jgi:murein DD-endopeptidase MepM/ murein hydrolase activator NlpD